MQPHLRYERHPDSAMCLVGDVVLHTTSGIPHWIPTRIEFPDGYPVEEPIPHEIGNRFVHDADHHFFANSDVACLWLDVASRWRPSDANALEGFLEELVTFYFRQLQMESNPSLKYPGPALSHGYDSAYVQHLSERLRLATTEIPRMRRALAGAVTRKAWCPCGSGKRYRNCHQREIARFRSRMRPERLQRLLEALVGSRQ